MNNLKSCIEKIDLLYNKYNFLIDVDGNLHKIIPKNSFIYLITLTILIIITYIIIKIPYIPITIIGNTIYSDIIASSIGDIPFIFCSENYVNCYSVDNEPIFFEGINFRNDNLLSEEEINNMAIPLTPKEILELESHTGLYNLDHTHKMILSNSRKYVINNKIYEPILTIKNISKDIFYLRTKSKAWTTKLIFTDKVRSLQINDILSCIVIDDSIQNGYIEFDNKKLVKAPMYKVTDDNKIIKLRNVERESIFYSLVNPLPFIENGIYRIHPFCLPLCWDIFLMISVITKNIIQEL